MKNSLDIIEKDLETYSRQLDRIIKDPNTRTIVHEPRDYNIIFLTKVSISSIVEYLKKGKINHPNIAKYKFFLVEISDKKNIERLSDNHDSESEINKLCKGKYDELQWIFVALCKKTKISFIDSQAINSTLVSSNEIKTICIGAIVGFLFLMENNISFVGNNSNDGFYVDVRSDFNFIFYGAWLVSDKELRNKRENSIKLLRTVLMHIFTRFGIEEYDEFINKSQEHIKQNIPKKRCYTDKDHEIIVSIIHRMFLAIKLIKANSQVFNAHTGLVSTVPTDFKNKLIELNIDIKNMDKKDDTEVRSKYESVFKKNGKKLGAYGVMFFSDTVVVKQDNESDTFKIIKEMFILKQFELLRRNGKPNIDNVVQCLDFFFFNPTLDSYLSISNEEIDYLYENRTEHKNLIISKDEKYTNLISKYESYIGSIVMSRIKFVEVEIRSVEHLIHLIKQLCNALIILNDIGYVHNDVRDPNVLVDENDHLTLIDFGICIEINKEICTSYELGYDDSIFFPPENKWSKYEPVKKYIPRSSYDLWAIGILIINWLTGTEFYYNKTPNGMYIAKTPDEMLRFLKNHEYENLIIEKCNDFNLGIIFQILAQCFVVNNVERKSVPQFLAFIQSLKLPQLTKKQKIQGIRHVRWADLVL